MSFTEIAAKVRAGRRLDFDEGVALFSHPSLLELGALANEVRERRHGDRTFFNRNVRLEVRSA